MDNSKRPALVGVSLLLAACLSTGAVAGDAEQAPKADGFAKLLAERDTGKTGPRGDALAQVTQPNPMVKLRTPTMVQAPMWSVIRVHTAPNGELIWGCTIEHRPLSQRPGNRIPN